MRVIGGAKNFWLYSEKEGYDITHPAAPDSAKVYHRMTLCTRDSQAIIDPTKTALVVVDLQNYFLSPAFGRPSDSLGLQVVERLTEQAIPVCRKAGISVLWLGWGLTDEDIETMPPAIVRGFAMDTNFEDSEREIPGLGTDIGPVKLDDGSSVDGGKVLTRDTWNSQLYSALYDVAEPDDMRVWKNRLSGFWGGTEVESVLKSRGVRTLIFAGCNTDQCVAAS